MSNYIFLTGAPGSRWSSIAKVLYSSNDFDTSDANKSYTKPGESSPMHLGAYWDPGMEYGNQFDRLPELDVLSVSLEFDRPFTDTHKRYRLVKSHQFANHLEYLTRWECPIIMAHRPDTTSYDWWLEAGGFDISYPSYEWYRSNMKDQIALQNRGIERFVASKPCVSISNSVELGELLGIEPMNFLDFSANDTTVYVYIPNKD